LVRRRSIPIVSRLRRGIYRIRAKTGTEWAEGFPILFALATLEAAAKAKLGVDAPSRTPRNENKAAMKRRIPMLLRFRHQSEKSLAAPAVNPEFLMLPQPPQFPGVARRSI
jgi:hypothetical protein